MVGFSIACVFLSLFLSSCLIQLGCCQSYQRIDLTSSLGVTCSMDSIYSTDQDTSLNCTGAINGNTDTTWRPTRYPNPNCVCDDQFASGEHYWQVDLGQTRNIHKITIYPERCLSDRYGAGCQQTCSARCQPDTCDSINGECTCNTGWTGSQCRACISGRHGTDCQLTCSAGCQNTACNRNTGRCSPCRTGWTGVKCDECISGRYGTDCDMECSAGCQNRVCNQNTGRCSPCTAGWTGDKCDVCVAGRYGTNCQQSCGAGCSTTTCNKDSGACTCTAGWATPRCDDCSPGHYSPNLGCKPCGAGCEDVTSCDPLTGLCSCQRGWEPTTCHVCKTKLWGDHCNLTCDDCAGDGSCDRANGVCYFGSPSGQSDSDTNTGAIVGAVIGAAVFLGVSVVIGALLIRSRLTQNLPSVKASRTASLS